MAGSVGFIDRHDLWTDLQRQAAEEVKARVERDGVKLVRLAWADPHGASRAKMLTVPAFLSALNDGYNINVATTTLDASGARVFSSFVRGGGMGLDEMTGSPNLIIVPDPATFRVLPWEPQVGWVLCDEYFTSGVPFHFSPRRLLREQIRQLTQRGMRCRVGLEVEWYLLRLADTPLTHEDIGTPGTKARAPRTLPAEPGYSLHSETNLDLMQPPLMRIAETSERLGLPLRSIENEWGPGQVECTFGPADALDAADNMVLFRASTRQVCRRMGYLATFMSRPKLKGFYASGWHLHQSLVDSGGQNLFAPETGQVLSKLGTHYLGGLLQHAASATVFANPTVNAYRRFRANSLAPDRLVWGIDHRGVLLRVLAGAGDPASRIENRVGEPSANPYLYIASQIATGLDGIDKSREPGPPDTDPYQAEKQLLPNTLVAALEAMESNPLFREAFGEIFVKYYLALKRVEAGRFAAHLKQNESGDGGEDVTEWEHNEYFDFF
jgi:glutamine synthetase